MAMTPDRFVELKRLFNEAGDLAVEERASFVLHVEQDCPDLGRQLRQLLSAADKPSDWLSDEGTAASSSAARLEDEFHLGSIFIPDRIGRYEIRGLLGEGGMGVVYAAEQDNPSREVAVKLIRPELSSAGMIHRFEREAELLGRLQHPGIAQIFESGTTITPLGLRPFFAMELIRGQSILEYSGAAELTTSERISLVIQVCDAVGHAHARGVIHRDLKPANLMVVLPDSPSTRDDTDQPNDSPGVDVGRRMVKVLDFGVGRFLDGSGEESCEAGVTLCTQLGQMVGTLPYMSPEQVVGRIHEIDELTDVYALGVILYELLSGHLPHELSGCGLTEAARIIEEIEPRPLGVWNRSLRGDVQTIVSKAMAKERGRRYGGAGELAEDLRRYLNDEPIAARAPSAFYQFRKFSRRNRGAVVGGAVAIVSLIAGAIVSIGLAFRATNEATLAKEEKDRALWAQQMADQERDRARQAERLAALRLSVAEKENAKFEAVNDFMHRMWESADPMKLSSSNPNPREVRVVEVLDGAAGALDVSEESNAPEVEAAMRFALGHTYLGLGIADEALTQLLRASEIQLQVLGDSHRDTLRTMNEVGGALQNLGRHREAEWWYQRVFAARRDVLGMAHIDTLGVLSNLAVTMKDQQRWTESESLFRDGLRLADEMGGSDSILVNRMLNNMGLMLKGRGRPAEAEPMFRKAVAFAEEELGANHPTTGGMMHNHSMILKDLGRLDEAVSVERQANQCLKESLGPGHPTTLTSTNTLGQLCHELGRMDEARRVFAEGFEAIRRSRAAVSTSELQMLNNYGNYLSSANRLHESEMVLRDSLRGCLELFGESHEGTMTTASNLAGVMKRLERFDEAAALSSGAIDSAERIYGRGHPMTFTKLNTYATVLANQGKWAEAEAILADLVLMSTKSLPADHWYIGHFQRVHGSCLVAMGRVEEAERQFSSSLAIHQNAFGPDDDRTQKVAELLEASRRPLGSSAVAVGDSG
jgi:serine/threonine protein kinase/Tfp pilus assembly protein PilF